MPDNIIKLQVKLIIKQCKHISNQLRLVLFHEHGLIIGPPSTKHIFHGFDTQFFQSRRSTGHQCLDASELVADSFEC